MLSLLVGWIKISMFLNSVWLGWVSRVSVCRGVMGMFFMVWYYDGWVCLFELVRWCDEEIVLFGVLG